MAKMALVGKQNGVVRPALSAMLHWRRHARPPRIPDGRVGVPLVWLRSERLPLIGPALRVKNISTNPVRLVRNFARTRGDMFTIRTSNTPDFTFLLHDDAFRMVLNLPPEHAEIGPVLAGIPTVGYWFPRAGTDSDSLQRLILTGRRMMATMMPASRVAELADLVPQVVDRHVAGLPGTARLDLTKWVYPVVYEASCRYFVGDRIWADLGAELTSLYRDIVRGIEITHIALSLTAFRFGLREYRATRRLYRLLRTELPKYRDEDSPLLRAIHEVRVDGEPLSAVDALWMFMYVLWNATVYPGAYTFWTLIDVVTRPELVTRLRACDEAGRLDLLARCLLENIRLYPVASLIRFLRKPLEFEHEGRTFHVPADQMVGVLPGVSNIDPRRVPGDPDEFDPDRHLGEPVFREGIFGRGAFACPAAEFNKKLTSMVIDEVLTRFDVDLVADPPPRRLRVPEIYPNGPTPARLTRLAKVGDTASGAARCPFA
jgi:cytochrome P450